ncbi:MAG: thioredoxin family protein [Clostridia bacterium]|nr:thioredoxin family protein [Clostridia bacterium]
MQIKDCPERFTLLEIIGDCAQCYEALPDAGEAAEALGIGFVHMTAGDGDEFLAEKKIEKVPALLLMCDGEEIARCYGYQPEEILEIWIDAMAERHLKET